MEGSGRPGKASLPRGRTDLAKAEKQRDSSAQERTNLPAFPQRHVRPGAGGDAGMMAAVSSERARHTAFGV